MSCNKCTIDTFNIAKYLKPEQPYVLQTNKIKQVENKVICDTFSLLLDYRNPFKHNKKQNFSGQSNYNRYYNNEDEDNIQQTKNGNRQIRKSTNTNTKHNITTHNQKQIKIQYLGLVNSKNNLSKTAYLSFDNQYFICNQGDSIENIKVISFSKNVLTVSINDSTINIQKDDNQI